MPVEGSTLISRFLPILVALLSGAILTFAFAPYEIWPLIFIGPIALLLLINKQTPKQAAWRAFYFGLGWFGAGISWVHVSIDQFGGLPLVVSLLLMLLLCAYLALYPTLATYVLVRFFTPKFWPLAFPALWYICEFLRSWVLTGFPWLSLGYSQTTAPLGALAPVIGETGISMAIVAISSCIAAIFIQPQYKLRYIAAASIIVIAAITAADYEPTRPAKKTVSIALVQGNIEQSMKWRPELEAPTRQLYQDLSKPLLGADIIVWPEAAIPSLEPLTQEFLATTDSIMAEHSSALVTGIIDYDLDNREFFNGMISLGQKQAHDNIGSYFYGHNNRYQKHHLLPIGEVVPFQSVLKHIAPLFNLPMSSFTRGKFAQDNLIAKGVHLAPAMCYEIVFPRQVRANIYRDTDALITVSNDAWFGDSHGPHQHMQMAQMRAREFARPLIRATNNGISGLVDHKGNITAVAPQFEEAVLSAGIELRFGDTRYWKNGETTNIVFMLIGLLLPLALQRKKRTDD